MTLILRLERDALKRGLLEGWAELVSASERLPVDGPGSILEAAQTAAARERPVAEPPS